MTPGHIFIAITVAVIWGIAFLATEIALESFSPPQLTVIRFVLAALPVFFVPKPDIPWRYLITIGMFLFTGQFLLLFFGFEAGMPPGLASVMTHTQALFTIVLAALLLKEWPNKRQSIGVISAFGGLALIALSIGGELTFLGLALTLAGAVSWSIGNIFLRQFKDVDMFRLVIWMCLVPPLPALCVAQFMGGGAELLGAIGGASARSLIAAVYLGVIATTLAYAGWAYLLGRYAAVQVTPFALFAPATGVIASYAIFGEAFGTLRLAGIILIMFGVGMTIFAGRKSA